MICKICNKDISNRGFGAHLKSHKLTTKEYYDKYLRKPGEGICPVCGKETTLLGLTCYRKYCSVKCLSNDTEIKEKRVKTNMQKYGVPYKLNLDEVKEKAKIGACSGQAKLKAKQTCLKHYGTENPNQSDIIKEKKKNTCLKKYGCEHALSAPEIRHQIQQTCLEKYGATNVFASEPIKAKLHNTITKNYGGMGASSKDIRDKMYKSLWTNRDHTYELYIYEKLKQLYPNAKHNYKSDKYPYHCDFYIPEKDLYIELNIYWMHGGHYFNNLDENDVNTVNYWKSRQNSTYDYAIKIWTESDLEKKKCAEDNHLNYLVFWTKQDIEDYIDKLSNS